MLGQLIKRYRSDAWDGGNTLTRFYEAVYECGTCNGSGQVEDEESEEPRQIECPECEGAGTLVLYE